ncbi:MAG: galactosyl transferase [Pigmentiphaga sp.]|uniref:galactosyl transferase n=1 Tax=Pigmentiphaga sp. TaxID=1977564 RepID=UPI0029BAD0AD|nr:galactosyl transferase [Pigmentiphaga sp.]MDX3906475.1 galactosyl transferase [Pigmentiphaga sp.]
MALITFIIPVRHQDNARDWKLLRANLEQTIASISSQSYDDWRGVIVANHGADLPELPEKFSVCRVDFSPNLFHEKKSSPTKEEFWDAFRLDKGRRVLAGMLGARDSTFFMIVDDDDFVSANIATFAARNPEANGWVITRGYIWDHGGRIMLGHDDFNHVCGTCLIVNAALYQLPDRFEDASEEWIKSMLGSHHQIPKILTDRGTPLQPLPFRGAVYRVAHPGSHSATPSLIRRYFVTKAALLKPSATIRNLRNLRRVDAQAQREFFGVK